MKLTKEKGGSQQDLINQENESIHSLGGVSLVETPSEIILTPAEREYLLFVQRGDISSLKRHIENYKDKPEELDINCLDPLRRSAVIIAIENENLRLLEELLQLGVKPKDALLHAINEDYVEGVELMLQFEEERHVDGQPFSWEMLARETSTFTKDITPLILAAHRNHYEILKILLDRGASLPMPHDIRCGCEDCLYSIKEDSLHHSLSRINAYKALSSPSLIALSSKDPFLTSFELSSELKRLEGIDHEFSREYLEQNEKVMKFSSNLLDQVRTKFELSTILNYDPEGEPWMEGEVNSLERVKSAIKHSQKGFVAHPNVQQILGAIWYDGLPGFRRKTTSAKCFEIGKIACMFPIFCLMYIVKPDSARGKLIKKPFVKFLCHTASYLFFLMLLALASQRIEYLLIEWFGNAWLQEVLEDWKMRARGSPPGLIELLIIIFVAGFVWSEIKSLWTDGFLEYIHDLWNIVDYITNTFYVTWILLRATSWIVVHRDLWLYDQWPWYPREDWHSFDPMLLSEGCFGAAMIFSFLKLINIFSVNPHLGPLQISLGRMIFDILKFFILYSLVLFAFGCGLNQLMWYYAELEMQNCYHLPGGLPDYYEQRDSCIIWRRFANLFESSQSLFWASFGLVELQSFDLNGVGSFTRFWSLLMFGTYSVINIIVLLNLLIAMMSNSYQAISEQSDVEWKFARTRLWMSYFEDGATVPTPFNLIPSAKSIQRFMKVTKPITQGLSRKKSSRKKADLAHQNVMRLLIRRFITEEQRLADEREVTEDDMNELKQDISTFRFELLDILKNHGWNTSMACIENAVVVGKRGRAIERKLINGFNIGLVEGLFNEVLTENKKISNIFSNLANAFKKKSKKDWNAKVYRASIKMRDQIGSSEISVRRSQVSLKKRALQSESLLNSMNPQSIVEYNPNLQNYTPATCVAYAKFKVNTLKVEKEKQRKEKEKELKEKAEKANESLKPDNLEGKKEYRTPTPTKSMKKDDKIQTKDIKSDKSVSGTNDHTIVKHCPEDSNAKSTSANDEGKNNKAKPPPKLEIYLQDNEKASFKKPSVKSTSSKSFSCEGKNAIVPSPPAKDSNKECFERETSETTNNPVKRPSVNQTTSKTVSSTNKNYETTLPLKDLGKNGLDEAGKKTLNEGKSNILVRNGSKCSEKSSCDSKPTSRVSSEKATQIKSHISFSSKSGSKKIKVSSETSPVPPKRPPSLKLTGKSTLSGQMRTGWL